MVQTEDIRVRPEKLHALGVRALTAVGIPEDHARMAADVLLTSDLRGIESHGFARLVGHYVTRARDQKFNLTPQVRIVQEALSAATVDGDNGIGFVAGTFAMQLAIQKAQQTGVGMVTVRNSTHYGPASPYALMALPHQMIGISMTTGALLIAPPGGARRTYGANALSFAAPAAPGGVPFVLDMATSVVPSGKFEIALRRGEPVPPGWGLDPEGRPIESDPNLFLQGGAGLPLGVDLLHGAWKGFGLSVMVDVLTGLLSGTRTSENLTVPEANHFFGAMRIDAFSTAEAFHAGLETMKAQMRAAPRQPGAPPLSFAGEPEQEKYDDYQRNGIPLHPSVLAGLQAMCDDLDLAYDLE